MPVDFRLSSFSMLNLTMGAESCLLYDYKTTTGLVSGLCVSQFFWFTGRTRLHSLFSDTSNQRTGVTALVAVENMKILRAIN